MLEQRVESDLKSALLAGDSLCVSTLRFIKSLLLNVKVEQGKRESGLSDEEVLAVLSKEAKKRQEGAELYIRANDQGRADKELAEKAIIETYLPTQLSEAEIISLIESSLDQFRGKGLSGMGQLIGIVKAKAGAAADGAIIARLVKQRLNEEQS